MIAVTVWKNERWAHATDVSRVRWSPRGDALYVSTASGLVAWSAAGERLWAYPIPYHVTFSLSADGRRFVTPDSGGVSMLDAASGALLWRHQTHEHYGHLRVAFTPADDVLVAVDFMTLGRLDGGTGTVVVSKEHKTERGCLDIDVSSDGLVAISEGRGVLICDAQSCERIDWLETEPLSKVAWGAGSLLTTNQQARLQRFRRSGARWDVDEAPSSVTQNVSALAVSPDGAVGLLAGSGHELVCAELDTGRERWRLRLDRPAAGLAVSPDGQTLAVATGRRLQFRSMESGEPLEPLAIVSPHSSLRLSPDGSRLCAGHAPGDSSAHHAQIALGARLLDTSNGATVAHLPEIAEAAFLPDGRLVAAGEWLGVVDAEGKTTHMLARSLHAASPWEHGKHIQPTPSPDGARLVSGEMGVGSTYLAVWDLAQGARTKVLVSGGSNTPAYRVAWSPDGGLVAAVAEAKSDVNLFETATWKRVKMKPGKRQPECLAWGPSGGVLYGATAGGEVWAIDTAAKATLWSRTFKKQTFVACAAAGNFMVVGAKSGDLMVLDGATGAERAVSKLDAAVRALSISQDGRLYVATEAMDLRVFDLSAQIAA